MTTVTHDPKLQKARSRIAARVRELRKQRRWTQAELAERLELSQSRLSEVERGAGSFTAEQFLRILQLFNVGASHFVTGHEDQDQAEGLQNVLARLGAFHLHERSDVLPSERLEEARTAVREALLLGAPRLVTALAPTLVRNADGVNLAKLQLELAGAGLERRVGWLAENTLAALRQELPTAPPRPWAQLYRRAEVLLEAFLARQEVAERPTAEGAPVDVLDGAVRSKRTLEEIIAASSSISRRWGVVTTIKPQDFADALRGARAVA